MTEYTLEVHLITHEIIKKLAKVVEEALNNLPEQEVSNFKNFILYTTAVQFSSVLLLNLVEPGKLDMCLSEFNRSVKVYTDVLDKQFKESSQENTSSKYSEKGTKESKNILKFMLH